MEIILRKLIIGTAQLGFNYGIANQNKKITEKQSMKFLEYCIENYFTSFDTASDYASEKILGSFIKKNNIKNINISTKIPSLKLIHCNKKLDFIKSTIESSLKKLNVNNLDTVLFHDENDFFFFKSHDLQIHNIFKSLKVKNLGFSIYSRKIFNSMNKNKYIKSIQIPINIVNKDFWSIKSNKKIIGRSIFLQGILIKSNLNTKNRILRDFNKKLFNLADQRKIDLYSLCLKYVLKKSEINKLVIGFDNIEQLKKILKNKKEDLNLNKNIKLINSIISKKNYDIIIDPRKW